MKIFNNHKITSKASIVALLMAVSLVSCKKNQVEGPELNDIYGEFFIEEPLTASAESVNFTEGSVHFNAKASVNTDWKLEVIGQNTNATYVITGKTKEININNSLWTGQASDFPSFNAEPVIARLTYPGRSNDTMTVGLNITGKRQSDTLLVESRVISNFPNGRSANMPVIDRFPTSAPATTFNSPVGNPYIYANGFANTGDGWAGGYYIPANVMSTPHVQVSGRNLVNLPNRPNDIYLNIAVYNTGVTSSFMIIRCRQDDDLNGFDEVQDNSFDFTISLSDAERLNWPANTWRLFSIRYADMVKQESVFLPSGETANLGDGVKRPHRITQVAFLHFGDGTASIAYDMPVFTVGRPFQP